MYSSHSSTPTSSRRRLSSSILHIEGTYGTRSGHQQSMSQPVSWSSTAAPGIGNTGKKQSHQQKKQHVIRNFKSERPPSAPSTHRFAVSNGRLADKSERTQQDIETYMGTGKKSTSYLELGDLVDDLTYVSVLKSDIFLVQRRIDELRQSLKGSMNGAIMSDQRRGLEDQLSHICCSGSANTNGNQHNMRAKITLFEILFNKMAQLEKELLHKTKKFSEDEVYFSVSDGGLSRLPLFFAIVSRMMSMHGLLQMMDEQMGGGVSKLKPSALSSPGQNIGKKIVISTVSRKSDTASASSSTDSSVKEQTALLKQRGEMEKMEKQILDLRGKLEESQKTLLLREKELLAANRGELEQASARHAKEMNELRQEMSKLKRQKREREREEKDETSQQSHLEKEIGRLRVELEDRKRTIDYLCNDYDNMQKQYIVENDEKLALQTECKQKELHTAELARELEALREQLLENQQHESNFSPNSTNGGIDNRTALEETKWHQLLIVKEQDHLKILDKERAQHTQDKQSLEAEHNRATMTLSQRLRTLECELVSQKETIVKTKQQNESERKSLLERINDMERRNTELDARKNKLNEHKLKLEKDIHEYTKTQAVLEKTIKRQKSENVRLQAVEEKYVELRGEDKGNQQQKHETGGSSTVTMRGKLSSAQQYMKQMEQGYTRLNQETSRLQKKLDTLKDFESLYRQAMQELEKERNWRKGVERHQKENIELPLAAMREVKLLSDKIVQAESALKNKDMRAGFMDGRARRSEQLTKRLRECQEQQESLQRQLREQAIELAQLRQHKS